MKTLKNSKCYIYSLTLYCWSTAVSVYVQCSWSLESNRLLNVFRATVFVVHGLRLFAVSEHFWWFLNLYKNLDCKSTEIIPPNNSKGKMYNSYVHNASHSSRKFPVRHSILPPKIKQRQFALASVSILLLWPYSTVQLLFLLYLWEILSYSIQRAYQQLNGHAIL